MAVEDPKKVTEFMDQLAEANQGRQAWRDSMREVYKLYRLYRAKKSYQWQANIVVPKLLEIVEAGTAKLVKGIYAYRPVVNINPSNKKEIEAAARAERLVDHDLTSLEAFVQAVEWVKCGVLFGYGVRKSNYADGQLIDNLVDPFAFIPDPYATTHKLNYCFEIREVTLGHLEELAKAGVYDSGKVKALVESLRQSPAQERAQEIGRGGPSRATRVKLVERWVDDNLTVLANDEVFIREEEGLFKDSHGTHPYSFYFSTPVPMEFFPIGDGEAVRPGNEELNEIRNQRLDSLALYLNQVLVVDPNKVTIDDILWRPGKIIPATDTDGIKPLVQPNVAHGGTEMETTIKDEMEGAAGAYRYATGGAPDRAETATGIVSLQSKGNERYDLKQMLLGYSFAKMAEKHLRLYQAYMEKPKSVGRKQGGQHTFEDISRENIQGKFRFAAGVTAASEDKFIRRRDLLEMYREFKEDPNVNVRELVKRVIESFDLPDSEALLLEENFDVPDGQPGIPGQGPPPPGPPSAPFPGMEGGAGGIPPELLGPQGPQGQY
jgi:hypothetical protein